MSINRKIENILLGTPAAAALGCAVVWALKGGK
jgi:hypothetical protein